MKKLVFILGIVLVLTFMFVITASATKPTEISGYFYFIEPFGPADYCISTGESYLNPDGFLAGCVDQLESPGIGAHGVLPLTVNLDGEILEGDCEYNLRTYDIDGIARFVANRCNGDLAGFHMKGVSVPGTFLWEGSYHFKP